MEVRNNAPVFMQKIITILFLLDIITINANDQATIDAINAVLAASSTTTAMSTTTTAAPSFGSTVSFNIGGCMYCIVNRTCLK